jgi:hypothetical protein
VIGTVAVIELTGLPAILALLAPIVVLVLVIVRLRRAPVPEPGLRPEAARAVSGEAAAPAPAAEPPAPVDWALRIRSAEAASDHGALAALYLSYAQAEIAAGHPESAAEHLRSSVRAATRTRNVAVQAEARLELAELARAAGDLTTACEHWQIARALFHDLKLDARRGETERLMQQHGCPTDWVLNDF